MTHTSPNSAPPLEFRQVSKFYGELRALDSLGLQAQRGEVLGFLGPNGAGKTTTIRIALGLLRASSGQSFLFGQESWRGAVEARRRVGYLPGDVRLYDGHTGRSFLALLIRLRSVSGLPSDQMLSRALEFAERLDLQLSKPVRTYSKGNKQKLGLVQAMMHEPDLLILDEPTSALDPLIQETVYQLIREHAARGAAVFFSSHVLSEVDKVCHRVAILRQGKLLDTRTVSDMRDFGLRRARIVCARSEALAGALRASGFDPKPVAAQGHRVEVTLHGDYDRLISILAGFEIEDLSVEPLSLEEIFFDLYHGSEQEKNTESENKRVSEKT
jgi:ABC-2 type transport system ATP-binding protein